MSGQKPEFYFFNIYVILLILLNIKRRTYSFCDAVIVFSFFTCIFTE